MDADPAAAHPSDEDVAAYLERTLTPPGRRSVETHLAECEQCRDRLMFASEVRQTAPVAERRRPRMPPVLAVAALAAVLAGVLLLPRSTARGGPEPAEFRASVQELESRELRTHAPAPNAILRPDALRLTWSNAGHDVLYQVTLSAADGRMLWSDRVSDTTVAPPPTATDQLRSGERYFWRVDALLPDLRSLTTGEQRFRVSPP